MGSEEEEGRETRRRLDELVCEGKERGVSSVFVLGKVQ